MHQSISSANTVNASSALFQAIKDNKLDVVETILNSKELATGEQIDCLRNEQGLSAMHLAAFEGHLSIIQALRKRGASIDISMVANGSRPIHLAVKKGHLKLVRSLVDDCGADPSAKDENGSTLLHWAATEGHQEIAEWLSKKQGVELNARDKRGFTPLHGAAIKGHQAIVEWLIKQQGVDPNTRDRDGLTPLHEAANKGHRAIVEWLSKQQGVNLNDKTPYEFTPLHLAAVKGHQAVVEWLIKQQGVDLNAKNYEESTPLHLAVYHGHQAVVESLSKQQGVDLNATDKHGYTPLHWAAVKGDQAIVEWLSKQQGVDLNATDKHGYTPLHWAAVKGDQAIVEWLSKQQGVDLNAKTKNGRNILHCAAIQGHHNVIKWGVIIGKVDPDVLDNIGRSALTVASLNKQRESVVGLLEIGVNIQNTLTYFEANRDTIKAKIYNYYYPYLSEVNTVVSFFSNPSIENARNVNQILEYLEKYRNLNVRNSQRKSLLDLMLQNFIDKSEQESGISTRDKDTMLLFFANQLLSDFRAHVSKNEEEEAKDFENFVEVIERLTNSIQNGQLKCEFLLKLIEKYHALMIQENWDYTQAIIETYENILKFINDHALTQKIHLVLANLYLSLNSEVEFTEDDERGRKAKYHAFRAGDSVEAVQFRKLLVFGLGNHDNEPDPMSGEFLSLAYNSKMLQFLNGKNQATEAEINATEPLKKLAQVLMTPAQIEECEEAISSNKRAREDKDELRLNQEQSLGVSSVGPGMLLHSYQSSEGESVFKKNRNDLAVEPNDKQQGSNKNEGSIKNTNFHEDFEADLNPNNNNNNIPLRRP